MSAYSEQLKDPRWQRKRLEILQRDNWKCVECHKGDVTLNVHHRLYIKGAKPWEYEDSQLSTLCEDCHRYRHELQGELDVALAYIESGDMEFVLGFAECIAWIAGQMPRGAFPLAWRSETRGDLWLQGFTAARSMLDPSGLLTEESGMLGAERPSVPVAAERSSRRLDELERKSRTTRLTGEELAEFHALSREQRGGA
jgi:hypothetical protein